MILVFFLVHLNINDYFAIFFWLLGKDNGQTQVRNLVIVSSLFILCVYFIDLFIYVWEERKKEKAIENLKQTPGPPRSPM